VTWDVYISVDARRFNRFLRDIEAEIPFDDDMYMMQTMTTRRSKGGNSREDFKESISAYSIQGLI